MGQKLLLQSTSGHHEKEKEQRKKGGGDVHGTPRTLMTHERRILQWYESPCALMCLNVASIKSMSLKGVVDS